MAGLINTGIWGFISSAKATGKKILNAAGEEVDEWVSTFVSGVSGWLIDKLGNAEFKSVFVREKFITNEFVYNRIRVTEDEEIVTSSIKIASYFDFIPEQLAVGNSAEYFAFFRSDMVII